MPEFNRAAQDFMEEYPARFSSLQEAANEACDTIKRILRDTGAFVHVTSGRAKTLDSLRGKFRRKVYKKPKQQLTDLVGVRVITYYRDAVDVVAERLRQELEISPKASTDKRLALGLRAFGYRSVHLIARLKPAQIPSSKQNPLQKLWFEIQIRSVLEHAWAEIEHEVVYKSGIDYPKSVLRRFAGIAANLELLDNEFLALREARNALIDDYRVRYLQKSDWRKPFDVARLLGFLEAAWPNAQGWRSAAMAGTPFAPKLDLVCVQALRAVGLKAPISLHDWFASARFQRALQSFAALQGIAPNEVSHFALVGLAVTTKNREKIRRHFPEILSDPAIAELSHG
jgi:ppGpp synthetase/RelA/SpoT-type nucleotidyltranferase